MRHRMFPTVNNQEEQKKKAIELIESTIKKLKQELGKKADELIMKIESRQNDFTQALDKALPGDRDRILKQYQSFALTLNECVNAPTKVERACLKLLFRLLSSGWSC